MFLARIYISSPVIILKQSTFFITFILIGLISWKLIKSFTNIDGLRAPLS